MILKRQIVGIALASAICSIALGQFDQETRINADDAFTFDVFGTSLTTFDRTLVVGATGDESNTGAAYVFTQDSMGEWQQQAKLTASDGISGGLFGRSVSYDGSTLLVGARDKAYVFEQRTGGNWTETQRITGLAESSFGNSVAIDGDSAIIGANTEFGVVNDAGAAYVFERDGQGLWSQVDRLFSTNPIRNFGNEVALQGTTAVVGSRVNGVRVYERQSPGNWQRVFGTGDGGNSVSIDGDTIVVGGRRERQNRGAAYILDRDAMGNWASSDMLLPSDPSMGAAFGAAVSVEGDQVVIGASTEASILSNAGAAYVFGRDQNSWSEIVKLTSSDPNELALFGVAVGLQNGAAFVGSPFDLADGQLSGSVYSYVPEPSGSLIMFTLLACCPRRQK